MRLIEQVAAMLASVIAKQKGGQFSEAKIELEEKMRQTAGIGLNELKRMSPEAVAQLLASSGALRYGRAVIAAELLLQDASISEAMGGNSDALLCYVHSFCLLSETIDTLSMDDQSVYRPKLEALAARLRDFSSHPYVSGKLLAYQV